MIIKKNSYQQKFASQTMESTEIPGEILYSICFEKPSVDKIKSNMISENKLP